MCAYASNEMYGIRHPLLKPPSHIISYCSTRTNSPTPTPSLCVCVFSELYSETMRTHSVLSARTYSEFLAKARVINYTRIKHDVHAPDTQRKHVHSLPMPHTSRCDAVPRMLSPPPSFSPMVVVCLNIRLRAMRILSHTNDLYATVIYGPRHGCWCRTQQQKPNSDFPCMLCVQT